MSKKHVKGEKGTEFSRCVKAAAKLREGPRSRSPLTDDRPVADDRALPEEHGRLAGGDSVE